jgi:hypothetical protein
MLLSSRLTSFVTIAGMALCLVGAAGPAPQYSSEDKPWEGNNKEFVRAMLKKWRKDYERLPDKDLEVPVRDVMFGLQKTGDRYTIRTTEAGSITFHNKDDVLHCTIDTPQ